MKQPQPRLILASGSRYRRSLLEQLGLAFEQAPPDVDETPRPGESAHALALRLAGAKAAAVAATVTEGWVIGSDQVAALGERILGKPGTAEKAREQLADCSGRTVEFHSGLCLRDAETGRELSGVETTTVEFRKLSESAIQHYVDREPALDCAGSFRVEGLGISLFRAVRSDDPTTLVGLPLIRLCDFLAEAGFELP